MEVCSTSPDELVLEGADGGALLDIRLKRRSRDDFPLVGRGFRASCGLFAPKPAPVSHHTAKFREDAFAGLSQALPCTRWSPPG